jgi:hypothetical protein
MAAKESTYHLGSDRYEQGYPYLGPELLAASLPDELDGRTDVWSPGQHAEISGCYVLKETQQENGCQRGILLDGVGIVQGYVYGTQRL